MPDSEKERRGEGRERRRCEGVALRSSVARMIASQLPIVRHRRLCKTPRCRANVPSNQDQTLGLRDLRRSHEQYYQAYLLWTGRTIEPIPRQKCSTFLGTRLVSEPCPGPHQICRHVPAEGCVVVYIRTDLKAEGFDNRGYSYSYNKGRYGGDA